MSFTEPTISTPAKRVVILRWTAAIVFVLAGINHFRSPVFYESIVPPQFPSPKWCVILSGIGEIAGGLGLLIPRLRRTAGWGLIALLIAVFPANIYMIYAHDRVAPTIPLCGLLLRLPLQIVLIAWVAGSTELGRSRTATQSHLIS